MPKPTRQALTRYQLADEFGQQLAAALIRRFGGRRIPRPTDLLERHERIRADLAHDSYEVVAERYRISVSQVVRIGKRPALESK